MEDREEKERKQEGRKERKTATKEVKRTTSSKRKEKKTLRRSTLRIRLSTQTGAQRSTPAVQSRSVLHTREKKQSEAVDPSLRDISQTWTRSSAQHSIAPSRADRTVLSVLSFCRLLAAGRVDYTRSAGAYAGWDSLAARVLCWRHAQMLNMITRIIASPAATATTAICQGVSQKPLLPLDAAASAAAALEVESMTIAENTTAPWPESA